MLKSYNSTNEIKWWMFTTLLLKLELGGNQSVVSSRCISTNLHTKNFDAFSIQVELTLKRWKVNGKIIW